MGLCFSAKVKAQNTGPHTARRRSDRDILRSSNLKRYNIPELVTATGNFDLKSIIGNGGFGMVYKGWIDENSLAATKPGTGIAVAVKKLRPKSLQGHREWLKPIVGWHKCNVDAGFHQDLNKTSAGWVVRNHTGMFSVAGTSWQEGNLSIMEGEARALLEAMKEVNQKSITHVIFETDSKGVVDALHTLHAGSSIFSSIICKIKNVLLLNSNFVVKFIKRQANMAAHSLARTAISKPSHCIFEAEVNYLGMFSHPNLVRLIGYCLEDYDRLLVYELMPLGSLEDHLFSRYRNLRETQSDVVEPLSWSIRLKVALDAAKVLAFLHSATTKVIYRDFKTSNILLDSDYNAKLSDFGLARDGPNDNRSHVSTRIMGTEGYADPEYVDSGHLTTKSDVYSFGVVLLEILTGELVLDMTKYGKDDLVRYIKPHLADKTKIFGLLDSELKGQYSTDEAYKVATLALQCLSLESKFRPNMDEVVKTLEQLQVPNLNVGNQKHADGQPSNLV